ncbi:GNAT family N-acetyltransferase, partial [Escherichia coli]|nr:GNAT family N-acetyltransferase [Escherichia coli]
YIHHGFTPSKTQLQTLFLKLPQ